jgi:DnaD/phage-associated family protein
MKIYTDTPEGMTVVQNAFIDQFMPHANGEFVKVYLYLLRCANTDRELSLSSIADVFDHTEKDVQRALTYWEKQQLMRVNTAQNGVITSVTFTSPAAPDRNLAPDGTSARNAIRKDPLTEDLPGYSREKVSEEEAAPSRDRIAAMREQKDIKQLIYVAEQYLQRPLTSGEQSDFIYYYDNLKFSTDLIEYLLEYCISKGSTNRHYMRKVALSWAEAGITSVLQAKQESNLYNKNYFTVLNTFGIKGRGPAAPEQEVMARWFDEFGFSIDIVLEACRRTIRQTHQPNFQYADKILVQWKESGVTSMKDVVQLDQKRQQEQKKPAETPQKSSANRFNNFSQRQYDYNQLEKQLLNQ